VNDSVPFGGSGAKVKRDSAPSALSTAPRIQACISGLRSAATTSMPKCSARAAQPPPITPVPSRPSVFTCRITTILENNAPHLRQGHGAAVSFYNVIIII